MIDFMEKYSDLIFPEPMSGCFLWAGSWTSAGYGNFTRYNRTHYAHRSAFEFANGLGSANGKVVRHRCDNPCCCNPEHLEIGTQKDNSDDAWRRGRMHPAKGEKASNVVLTESQVLEARSKAQSGMTITDVAASMGLNRNSVDYAVRGKSWKHLPGAVPSKGRAT